MKGFVLFEMPDDWLEEFAQMVRDFDTAHDPQHEGKCVMEVFAETSTTSETIEDMFRRLVPKFPFISSFKVRKQ
jgi:hypothetical protein